VGTSSVKLEEHMCKCGLGPCFSGCLVGTILVRGIGKVNMEIVSVLVLVDVWWVHEPFLAPADDWTCCLSRSLF